MKTQLFLLALIILSFNLTSQNFVWARSMGGFGFDIGYRITVDASGNVYTIGIFQNTANFGSSDRAYNLTSNGRYDIFVSKFDSFGNFIWAKSMGGVDDDYGFSIAVDASGNVYTTGFFIGTSDFDPGPGTYNLTSSMEGSAFISKLDSLGNFIWAKGFLNVGVDRGYSQSNSIAFDASGNVYTTGSFSRTVDFDPGPGTYNLTSGDDDDIFISKLDFLGNFVWTKRMGSNFGNDRGFSNAIDALGNVYYCGEFEGTVDFDPDIGTYNLTSAGELDIFILKLDASGKFVWAKNIGGPGRESGSLAIDQVGNVFITGQFEGTADFDPGPGIYNLTSAGSDDIFIAKLDASGNFVWAKSMGGDSSDQAYSVAVDASKNVYTTGFYEDTADFDPGSGTYNLISVGKRNYFISKLDSIGNFIWAKSFTGIEYFDNFNSIAVDKKGNSYTTGTFQETRDFDPGPGIYNITSIGLQDIFILKLGNDNTTSTKNIFKENDFEVFPIPSNDLIIIHHH